jgi:hypothetical protein
MCSKTEGDFESVRSKKIQCLQLLMLVIPEPNYNLLKDLFSLLKRVTERVEDNREGRESTNMHYYFFNIDLI